MPEQPTTEEFIAKLRSRLHAAHLDSGKSLTDLTRELGFENNQETSEYLSGKKEITAVALLKFARATGKPVWWFYGDEPEGITVEAAETALQNIGRIKLYLEALEGEVLRVTGARPEAPKKALPMGGTAQIVDLAPYLQKAREILEHSFEESGEVSDESIEMVAKGLYSAELGLSPLRSQESSQVVSLEKRRKEQ